MNQLLTTEQEFILIIINAAPKPFFAREIKAEMDLTLLAFNMFGISRSKVYENLRSLERNGMIEVFASISNNRSCKKYRIARKGKVYISAIQKARTSIVFGQQA